MHLYTFVADPTAEIRLFHLKERNVLEQNVRCLYLLPSQLSTKRKFSQKRCWNNIGQQK